MVLIRHIGRGRSVRFAIACSDHRSPRAVFESTACEEHGATGCVENANRNGNGNGNGDSTSQNRTATEPHNHRTAMAMATTTATAMATATANCWRDDRCTPQESCQQFCGCAVLWQCRSVMCCRCRCRCRSCCCAVLDDANTNAPDTRESAGGDWSCYMSNREKSAW